MVHLIVTPRESVPLHRITKKEVEKQYFQLQLSVKIGDMSSTKYPRYHLLPTDEKNSINQLETQSQTTFNINQFCNTGNIYVPMSPLLMQKGRGQSPIMQRRCLVFTFCDRHVSPPIEAGCYLFCFFPAICFVSPFWRKVSVECLWFLVFKDVPISPQTVSLNNVAIIDEYQCK